jgi:hypothetical protein
MTSIEEKTMADRTEQIGKADFKEKADEIDVDKAWEDAKKWMSKINVSTTSKPDVKKIREAMAKQKKAMTFVASWDGKWLSIDARVGTVVVDKESTQDMSEGGDQKKWRDALELLKKNTKLVNDADLKAFDDKHPDPDEVNKLKAKIDTLTKEIKVRTIQIKRLQEEVTPRLQEIQRLQKTVKALGG